MTTMTETMEAAPQEAQTAVERALARVEAAMARHADTGLQQARARLMLRGARVGAELDARVNAHAAAAAEHHAAQDELLSAQAALAAAEEESRR